MKDRLCDKNFGERLGIIIESLGLTQAEVARNCGITQACLSQVIGGQREPNLRTIVKILNFIPVSFENLYDAAFARPCGQNEEKLNHGTPGLTKLEWYAGLALQGLSASIKDSFSAKNIAEGSIKLAKALIDELNKEENNE